MHKEERDTKAPKETSSKEGTAAAAAAVAPSPTCDAHATTPAAGNAASNSADP